MTHKQAKVISISNHKGGVGKSCSTCNIGAGLAKKGKRVLLIDLDPQANLSLSLGIKESKQSIYDVLVGKVTLNEVCQKVQDNLHLIPSHLDLAGAEIELSSEAGREVLLKEVIKDVLSDYDYILIDCAPSLGLLTTNAMTASEEVYIPLQAQFLSLQGIAKLTGIIEKIQRRLNKNLSIGGVIITQYNSRKILNRDVASAIDKYFDDKVFKTKIRDNIALAEAPSRGLDIFKYNPKSNGAKDYAAVCEEILDRDQKIKAGGIV